jgi:hypothetical protein
MITASAIRKNGIIYTGKRHHLIMHSPLRPKGFLKFGEQGFITDKGEFLDREAAAKHAISSGQITNLKYSLHDLFSEDLW